MNYCMRCYGNSSVASLLDYTFVSSLLLKYYPIVMVTVDITVTVPTPSDGSNSCSQAAVKHFVIEDLTSGMVA